MGEIPDPRNQQDDLEDAGAEADSAMAAVSASTAEMKAEAPADEAEKPTAAERLRDKAESISEAVHDMKESAKENMPKAAAKAAVASGAIAVTVAAAAGPAAQAAPPAAASPGSEGAPTAVTQSAQTSPGVAKLKKLCDGSDAGICKAPKWTEEHLQFDSVLISRYVSENWPQIDIVGGWRPSDPYPDHPSGRAVDIMVPNGGQGNGKEVGQEIADYFQEHAKEFGVDYILWRQQSWSADSGSKQWKAMEDRGDPTSNHVDHVHITVHGDKSTIAEELIAGAGDSGGGEAKTIAQSVNDSAEAAIIVKAVTEEQA